MSPPANPVVVPLHPRTLKTMLDELSEAVADKQQAYDDLRCRSGSFFDANDRAAEAEQRIDDLRAEFDAELLARTGLTFDELMKAREGCLL